MDSQSGLALVILAVVMFTIWLRSRLQILSTFRIMGIPGPKPSLLSTNVKEVWREKKPWVVIDEWTKEYGKIFGCFPMGIRPILVISDTSILQEILVTNFSNFRNRPALGPPRPEPGASTLTSLRGERWKRVRNVISPTFSAKKVRQTAGSMHNAASTLITLLKDKSKKPNPFDIYQMFQALTLDVIAQAAFALQVNSQTDPDDALLTMCRGVFKSIFTPALKILLLFPELGAAAKLMHKKSDSSKHQFCVLTHMKKVFHERRKNPGIKNNDMIQLMMDAADHIRINMPINTALHSTSPMSIIGDKPEYVIHEKTPQPLQSARYLTENELIANCFVFLLAGYETTANALAFTTFLLAKHQDVQERLYRDIVATVGEQPGTEFDEHFPSCRIPYLDAVIKESLRMYPPITGFVMRECAETCTINGLEIPAGMAIHIPVWTLHHDAELWPNPSQFNPDRFMPDNVSAIQEMAFMAFGEGPRNCIGMSFAMMEIRITLVQILQRFRIENIVGQENLELQSPFVTMNPSNGVFVRLERRQPTADDTV
ncbi:thromboxane-A synthase-like [Paramacrobiotus metropolitanus]|uniref:thromboxane-A synthase-like n=1 Tax=Paramacrobiotus metropolitanus TaxID=2943436 RepID=UPI00244655C0|nr:thromboxane-A synthase-like [Paramacrobiotus metropolitanus]XP_055337667.1 thromboxane-A synthase-like [Paramacrobiotus metropolitanus]